MTNHELIKNSFEEISPSEELLAKTLSQSTNNPHKNIHAKRVLTAAFAACAVLVLGVTAAAAGGYIDFDAVFGDYIKVPNSELAASMIGNVSDLRYKVSDKNYKFTVKGAVGDERNAMFILELSRTDGTPVTEHFNFDTDEKFLNSRHNGFDVRTAFEDLNCSGGYGYRINEEGNIEIHLEGNGSESINGKIFKVYGENFYTAEYFLLLNEKNIYYGLNNGKWAYYHSKTNTPADFDDSSLRLLDLEWEVSFRYTASEDSIKTLTCKDLSQEFIYYQDIREMIGKEDSDDGTTRYYSSPDLLTTTENKAKAELIEIGAVNGRITFNYKHNEYEIIETESPRRYSVDSSQKNEMYIIYKDGTHFPVTSGSCSSSQSGSDENVYMEVNFYYSTDDYSAKTFIELDKAEAFYINGVTYKLE